MNYLGSVARLGNIYFLTGLVGRTPDGANVNSAAMFSPEGKILSRYDKINLVPFGEYVPWGLGPIAFKISSEAGDFRPGSEQVVTPLNDHRAATFICYESVFPRFISRFVRDGAEVLVNPSNDGWFGKTAARRQHLEIVRMRAVENRRWILRDTNDGITAAIDPSGALRQQLPLYQEASAAMNFSYRRDLTIYTRWGDWFVGASLLIWLASCVELRVRRRP